MPDDSLNEVRFPSDRVSVAAGMSQNLLKSWIGRGFLDEELDGVGTPLHRPGHGKQRLFWFSQVIRLAIARELTSFGFEVPTALRHALKFTHFGSSAASWGTADSEGGKEPFRHPGRLFVAVRGGAVETWLAACGDEVEVFGVEADDRFTEVIGKLGFVPEPKFFGSSDGVAFLNVTEIWNEVMNSLEFNPSPEL